MYAFGQFCKFWFKIVLTASKVKWNPVLVVFRFTGYFLPFSSRVAGLMLLCRATQGPRSNFEIGGGGGTISDSILGGAQVTFSY